MKYQDEFNDPKLINELLEQIKINCQREHEYRIMEFCGGHTHSFFQSGLIDLLPHNIKLVHGPGCPVCVMPSGRIAAFITVLENNNDAIGCIFGDLLRIPTQNGDSLLKAKARGCDVRIVYSPLDALKLAKEKPNKKIIFFGIGFETTTPATVLSLRQAKQEQLDNYFIYCNHVKTAPALEHILANLSEDETRIDGIIAPGHVAAVTGGKLFAPFVDKYKIPMAIGGFTPFDLAKSILELIKLINDTKYSLVNEYNRVVTQDGNKVSQQIMDEHLTDRESFECRGLGELPVSAWRLKDEFKAFDAEAQFTFENVKVNDHPACLCPRVLLGKNNPLDCKLFGKACTPTHPLGSCMVSSEGACAAYFRAGKHKDHVEESL